MKKREIIHQNKHFMLVKQTRDHKTWYEIKTDYRTPIMITQQAKEYFGKPFDKFSPGWRFWNRLEAEKQFIYTTLRWT